MEDGGFLEANRFLYLLSFYLFILFCFICSFFFSFGIHFGEKNAMIRIENWCLSLATSVTATNKNEQNEDGKFGE